MNGTVTKLYDIDSIIFPKEMFDVAVDESDIDNKVEMLSMKYADEEEVSTSSEGDIVFCMADSKSYPDGRNIILYTGTPLPGGEDASLKAIGKSVGDTFEAILCEAKVTLTVKKIIRRRNAAVTDELISSMGIEDVDTVAAYREYLKEAAIEELRSNQSKLAAQYALEVLVENSEFSYDEAQMDAHIQAMAEQYAAEYEQYGMEADMDDICKQAAMQIKQGWVAKAYCDSQGIVIDLSEMQDEIDQIIQMQQLSGDDFTSREEFIEMFMENQYMGRLFEALSDKIQMVMEA